MGVVTMKSLLEAGVHFGHGKDKWNPKMKKYIYATRKGVHIIDLQKTIECVKDAYQAVRDVVLQDKDVLFVGTKKQAQQIVESTATDCQMHYISNRWLGGMLTNFSTIKQSLQRYKKLEKMEADGYFDELTKKEVAILQKEKAKLEKNLKGIKDMQNLPGIIFVIDAKQEMIAVKEAKKLGIPVVATVDTNCDPTLVDYPIPANDDAVRSITLIADIIKDAVLEADRDYGLQIVEDEVEERFLQNQEIVNKERPQSKDSEEKKDD